MQMVVFSIIFGIALALIGEDKRRPMLVFCESLSEVMFKFTNIVMLFAPIGVAGAMAYTVGTMGFGVMGNLVKAPAHALCRVECVFVLVVLLPVALIARLPIKRFVKAVAEPLSIAFATASSEAALPRAMEYMEAFGVPRQIVAFVLPTGYSFNLDGSTLYVSLASIFVAQAAGIHLTLRPAARHGLHPDAYQQRRGRSSARGDGDPAGNAGFLPPAAMAGAGDSGH